MQSLRDRQIREVLDEDQNINRQVFDREKQQVRVFQDNVLPKKTRDTEAEISVDKLIENLNRILENKLTSLEYLLSKIVGTSNIGDAEGRRSYNNVVSNGDFITTYNQLIRVYTTQGISRNSQEIIKVKFQEIKPNIDAIIYGIEELVQYLFEADKSDKEIFQLIRSQAVYQIVKDQLYRGSSYKIIEQGDIQVSLKEVLSDLSEVQRVELRDISERDITEKSLLKLPIEIGQDEGRLQALEAEFGFRLPREIGEFGRKEREQAFKEYEQMGKDIDIPKLRIQLDENIQFLEERKKNLVDNLKKYKNQQREVNRQKLSLEYRRKDLLKGQPHFDEDDDLADKKIELEVPLADDIEAKNQELAELKKRIKDDEDEIDQINEDIQQMKDEFEEYIKQSLENPEKFSIEKKKFKKKGLRSVVPKESEEEAPEEAPEEKEPLSQLQMKDYYTKGYLNSLRDAQLRVVADVYFNYRPRPETDRNSIVNGILKKQEEMKIPKEQRRILGLGISKEPIHYNRTRDYGDLPLDGYDDRRDDIYYIQRQLKREL